MKKEEAANAIFIYGSVLNALVFHPNIGNDALEILTKFLPVSYSVICGIKFGPRFSEALENKKEKVQQKY